MSANIHWTERNKNLTAKYRPSENKENMYWREQNGKSTEGKNNEKKKGLSVRTENRKSNVVHQTRKPSTGGFQSQVSCNGNNESNRSFLHVQRSVRGEEIKDRQTPIEKTVSSKKRLERKRTIYSTLGLVPQRARSLSNNRNRNSVTKENKLTVKPLQRSYSETRDLSQCAEALPDSHIPQMRHLTNDVKKRTLSSIQTWKNKMKKLYTNSARYVVNVPTKNLHVTCSEENTTKSNLQKTCVIDNIKMPQWQSDMSGVPNLDIFKNNADVKESIPRDRTAVSVRNALDTMPTFSQNECATIQQNKIFSRKHFEIGVSANSTSHHKSEQDNNRLSNAGKLDSSIITPVDVSNVLTLTPTKVRYEKHRLRHSSPVLNNVDDIDHLLHENDYLEFVEEVERKREENSPKLSPRFLCENINAQQRKIIVGYLIRLSVHCQYTSDAVYHAVKLFDIAIDRILVCTDKIQLMALACFWITLKRDMIDNTIISATEILDLAKNLYLGQEKYLLMYEKKILTAVKFNICFADPFSLLSYYIWTVNRNTQYNIDSKDIKVIYYCASYLIDVSMLDENLCKTSVFVVVMAAVDLSFGFVSPSNIKEWPSCCQFWKTKNLCTEWEEREIKHVKWTLVRLILNSDQFGSNVIHKKYSRSKYGRISNFLLNKIVTYML